MGKTEYYHPYVNHKYIGKGPTDIGMSSIPKNERCDGFRDIWNKVFEQVMEYWEKVPVKDIREFDNYETVNKC